MEFSAPNLQDALTRLSQLDGEDLDIDDEYGAAPLNADMTTFLTRGWSDGREVAGIEKRLDVRLFPDLGVGS